MKEKSARFLNLTFGVEEFVAFAVIIYSLLFPEDVSVTRAAYSHSTREYMEAVALFTVFILLTASFFAVYIATRKEETGYNSNIFVYLAQITLIAGLWFISESGVLEALGVDGGSVGLLSFFSFHLLPVPFLLTAREVCTHGKKLHEILAALFLLAFVVNFSWMIILGIGYPPTLFVIQLLVALTCLVLLGTAVKELFISRKKEVVYTLVGLCCVVIFSMVDLVRFQMGGKGIYTYSILGVFIFVLLMIMGTGKSVVSSLTRARSFEIVANQIPSGFFRAKNDDSMTIVYANETFYKMYGFQSESEAKQAGFNNAGYTVSDEVMANFMRDYKANLCRGIFKFDLETSEYDIDGNRRFVLNKINYNPEVDEIFCSVVDITDRKLMEERLHISEEEYRIAVAQSEKYILRYDIQTRMIYLQTQTAEFFGLEETVKNVPESIIEMGMIAPESMESYRSFYEAMQNGQPVGKTVVRMKTTKSDQFSWYEGSFTTIYDNSGKPQHGVVSFGDITQAREKELAYERFRQEREMLPKEQVATFDCNLTADTTEFMGGSLLDSNDIEMGFDQRTETRAKYIHPDDRARYSALMNREGLLMAFDHGISSFSLEYRRIIKDQDYHWVRNELQLVQYPDSQEIKAFVVVRDINAEKLKQLEMKELSQTDPLTHALNRTALSERVEQLLNNSGPQESHAFFMIDLDNFKKVNDTFGHIKGDELLAAFVSHTKVMLREGDIVGRIGGDEFFICLKDVPSRLVVEKRAISLCNTEKLNEKLGVPISISIGISIYPQDGSSFKELYGKADAAMYNAKRSGKDRYKFFSKSEEE